MSEFFDAWWWLNRHPAFMSDPDGLHGEFGQSLDIWVAKVNPETGKQEEDPNDPRNTKVEIWLEAGRWMHRDEINESMAGNYLPADYLGQHCHDIDLDCGGSTFEDAIIEMARLVRQHYGDYETDEDGEPVASEFPTPTRA